MRYFARLSTLLLTATTAQAQVLDQKAFLALLETDHSPLLVPLSFDSVERVGDRLTLNGVDFGWFVLNELAFDVRAVADDQVRLDNFSFPTAADLSANLGLEDHLVWEAPTLSIVYNMKDEAPDEIQFALAPLAAVSATDGIDFAFDGLSLSMVADKDAGSMALDLQSGAGQIISQDFKSTLPSLNWRMSHTEYAEGVHPFVGLRTQNTGQSVRFESFSDVNQYLSRLITILEDLELPNASTSELQMSGFEVSLPGEGFVMTVGPTVFRSERSEVRNPEQATDFVSWTTDDLTFSLPDGRGTSIGQLFLEGTAEHFDILRLMSAFINPAVVNLASAMEQHSFFTSNGPNPALRESFFQPDLSTAIEDVLESLGKLEFSYGVRNISINETFLSISLSELKAEGRFDLTATDQGSAGFALGYANLDIPILAIMDPALAELLPTDMRFDFDISGVDLADLVDRVAGLADGDLAPDVDVLIQVQDMFAAWWQAAGAIFVPQGQIDTKATSITLAGTFPFDSEAAFGLTGAADVTISNFSQLKAMASSLLDNPDPGIAGYASGAITALEALNQFGDIDSKDTLTLDVKLDSSGMTTVNNLPVPYSY